MKVLVTGAGGQLGRELIKATPAHVRIADLSSAQLDIANAESVAAVIEDIRPDLIINAAAFTAVDRAEAEATLAEAVNAAGPANLANAARSCGARLIHLSTDYVFDGESSRPYRPDDVTAPLNVYGRTKLAGERAVLATVSNAAVLRTAWVYAAHGRNFVLTMLRLMKERGAVSVVADQIGAPTSAVSIADTIWRITRDASVRGVHHWTDGGVASWYDFAVAIAEEGAQRKLIPGGVDVNAITTEEFPTAARRPRMSILDCRSTIAATGAPRLHWRTWLRRTLDEVARA